MDCRVISAFTRVFDALCPAMTKRIDRGVSPSPAGLTRRSIFFAKAFDEEDGLVPGLNPGRSSPAMTGSAENRLVPQGGFEPSTYRLRSDCSAVELLRHDPGALISAALCLGKARRKGSGSSCPRTPLTEGGRASAPPAKVGRLLRPPPRWGGRDGGGARRKIERARAPPSPNPPPQTGEGAHRVCVFNGKGGWRDSAAQRYGRNSARMRLQPSAGGVAGSGAGSASASPLGPGSSGACTSGITAGATAVISPARGAR